MWKNPDYPNKVVGNNNLIISMKRLPGTLTLCFFSISLLTSGMIKNRADNSGMEFSLEQIHDTTGLIGYLKVDSFKLEILPPSSGVQFFKNGIVFLSNTKNEGKMLPKHVSFGTTEAYTAIVKDSSLGLHMLFSPASSFSFPCEAITFSSDFKTMYFTKIARKDTKEKIYHAELKPDGRGNSVWITDEKPLEFCTGDYRYTHPALSADGEMMIFASDRDGSLGGTDLFIVRKVGEKWSKPENPGKSINTPMNECFPFIDNDKNLFFSSDGLAGFGGYDIFTCKFNGETWENPMNLSGRINSASDDFAFSIDKTDGKRAFYTTREKSEFGGMQLYKIDLIRGQADNQPLSISHIYNGNPEDKPELVAINTAAQTKPTENETVKKIPEEVKKEIKAEAKKVPAGPARQSPESKVMTNTPSVRMQEESNDAVVYRIQFLSTTNPRKENQIVINGVVYETYEYFYQNLYRYTIGQFSTLSAAKGMQSVIRKGGYPQAFMVAFKNGTRSLDPGLFK